MAKVRLLLTLLLVMAGATSANAQEPAGPLAELQAKTSFTEEEAQQIRTFVTERVNLLSGDNRAAAARATAELRKTYSGSETFKQQYANVCIEVIGSAYKKTSDVVAATSMLAVLSNFQTLDALPVLVEALRDDRVGVRAAAAIGLRALGPKLVAAGREQWQQVLDAVVAAGKQEKSPETLKMIYSALDYSSLPTGTDLKPAVAALMDLLDARSQAYAAGGDVRASGADDTGLRLAAKYVAIMTADQKKRLTIITARMMKYAVERYSAGTNRLSAVRDDNPDPRLLAARDAMERLMIIGQQLLVTLLSPQQRPDVTDPMGKLDDANVRVQWQAWAELIKNDVNEDFTLSEASATETGGAGE